MKKRTTEEYQELVDFEVLEPYINARTAIKHRCSVGHEWLGIPNNILHNKAGCPSCSTYAKKTHEDYEASINYKVLEPYINDRTKIKHECAEGHQWFSSPNAILKGRKCPSCSITGFKPEQPAILYYLKLTKGSDTYYKVGVTNRTLHERFSKEKGLNIKALSIEHFNIGKDAYDKEQQILSQFKSSRKTIKNFLKGGGNTELFEYDILNLEPSL